MAEEAVVVEPGTEAPAEGTPSPEESPAPETPVKDTPKETPEEGSPESGPSKQEDKSPEQEAKPPEPEAEIQTYQDVLRKHKEDSDYQMTDAEAEAYLNVQNKIADGVIKDPGAAPKSDEKPAEEPEAPEKGEKADKGKKPEDGVEPEVTMEGLSDSNHDNLMKTMKQVGAKDISELPEKVEGLINHMKTSGGKQGTELASMKEREQLHISWIKDLQAGKPDAIKYLQGINSKLQLKSSTPKEDNISPEGGDEVAGKEAGEYLDDKLATRVMKMEKTIKDQADTITKLSTGDEKREAEHSRKGAADGWVDDIVDLVTSNQKDFKITPSEARALGKAYWGPGGHTQPVHPKFQQIHELIMFAHKRSMPDLLSAHVVWQHENGDYAKKLIKATKEGTKSVQHKQSENAGLSQKQSRTNSNVPSPTITDEKVEAMERGDFDSIPDEWMDDDGNLLRDKVPERFHKAAFGRMGKPK